MTINARAESPPYAALAPEAETISALREQIDALDTALTNLILVRSQLSHRIQLTRMSVGGPRVLLSREREIRQHYRDAMGADGIVIAEAVLRVCRGD